MRPFSGNSLINEKRKIFYYRLSRVHRIIEHTFGILVARWRIFQRPIEGTPDQVEKYVLATIALHNYLRQTDNACYTPAGFVDSVDSTSELVKGNWRKLIYNNQISSKCTIREYSIWNKGEIDGLLCFWKRHSILAVGLYQNRNKLKLAILFYENSVIFLSIAKPNQLTFRLRKSPCLLSCFDRLLNKSNKSNKSNAVWRKLECFFHFFS